ncbi:DUF4280 domain-containing protein [Apibacter raozihei]|uniref:DUF4280 domain-containing protein n=1 Tax=Apibacter raozihei TaxID=2500547 RepID=UPI000FE3A85C|nr:DUF4280 domain-containing protein [Apibacter raozihei]
MKKKHYVCQGAKCQCIYGSSPDKLLVKTHTKHYINDGKADNKTIATTLDVGATFERNTFGSCSQKNGNSCTAVITHWENHSSNVLFEDIGGGWALLEDSKAGCPIGGNSCIRITFHGQQQELCPQNFLNVSPFIHSQLNPLVDWDDLFNSDEDFVE